MIPGHLSSWIKKTRRHRAESRIVTFWWSEWISTFTWVKFRKTQINFSLSMDNTCSSFRFFILLCSFFLFISETGISQALDYKPKILLVTAHPDDDALFSATVFKTTRLLEGTADLAIMTNGEGGYRYSTLGNFIYNTELDREETGRKYLPGIRKKEVMAGGEIVGIRNYYFFDQVDDAFSLDIASPMESWDTGWIKRRLETIIRKGAYDFIFTMLPSEETHAHHKASAILVLQVVEELPEGERPIVLTSTIVGETDEGTAYSQLEGYPVSRIRKDAGPFLFDRRQTFGHNDRLNYKIIGNWVIAEHKSQGTMQLLMGRGNVEQYWLYEVNRDEAVDKTKSFFDAVNEVPIYRNPDIEFGN